MIDFSEVFTRHGTDKQTWHQYGPVYQSLFPEPEKATAVLEIGVEQGKSLLAWGEIFPNAVIVGLDVNPWDVGLNDGIEFHQGRMAEPYALRKCVGDRKFDLIVDDASHRIEDNLVALFYLWPHLKPGGYYVIEEFDDAAWGGLGPAASRESFGLFISYGLFPTPSPNGEEFLVVLRKP